MTETDKKRVDSILSNIFDGASVSGMRFFTPQIVFSGPNTGRQDGYVNLTSEWNIYDSLPGDYEALFHESSLEQDEFEIHKLRGEIVRKAEIAFPWPHLILHFVSGKVLVLNGRNDLYESWTAGLTGMGLNGSNESLQVIACPGGEIALFLQESVGNSPKA